MALGFNLSSCPHRIYNLSKPLGFFLIQFDAMAMKALALCMAAVGIHSPVLAFNSTCYNPPYQGGGSEGHVVPGDTPCSPSTDEDVARPCCGYADGSICLSNGLCFVPSNNSMLQGSCTDPSWTSPGCPNTKCVGMRAVLYISQ